MELLAPGDAHDELLVDDLVRLVNEAYAVGEAGLWIDGAARTGPDEIHEAIRSGGMLAAVREGRLVGSAYLRLLDANEADLGLPAVSRDQRGSGVGRELVRYAEELMQSRAVTTMQLELLVPKEWAHPEKERLRGWYSRLGYRVARSAPIEQVAAHLASLLATPCEFLVFRKPLAEATGPCSTCSARRH